MFTEGGLVLPKAALGNGGGRGEGGGGSGLFPTWPQNSLARNRQDSPSRYARQEAFGRLSGQVLFLGSAGAALLLWGFPLAQLLLLLSKARAYRCCASPCLWPSQVGRVMVALKGRGGERLQGAEIPAPQPGLAAVSPPSSPEDLQSRHF